MGFFFFCLTSKSQKKRTFNFRSRILMKSSLWRQNQLCAVFFICSYIPPPERALTSQNNSVVWTVKGNPYWVMEGRWWENGFLTFHKNMNQDSKRKKMLRPQRCVFPISDKTWTDAWSQTKTSFRLRSLNFALKPRPPLNVNTRPPRFSTHLYVYKYIYIIFDFFPPVWLRSSDARRFPALVKP